MSKVLRTREIETTQLSRAAARAYQLDEEASASRGSASSSAAEIERGRWTGHGECLADQSLALELFEVHAPPSERKLTRAPFAFSSSCAPLTAAAARRAKRSPRRSTCTRLSASTSRRQRRERALRPPLWRSPQASLLPPLPARAFLPPIVDVQLPPRRGGVWLLLRLSLQPQPFPEPQLLPGVDVLLRRLLLRLSPSPLQALPRPLYVSLLLQQPSPLPRPLLRLSFLRLYAPQSPSSSQEWWLFRPRSPLLSVRFSL